MVIRVECGSSASSTPDYYSSNVLFESPYLNVVKKAVGHVIMAESYHTKTPVQLFALAIHTTRAPRLIRPDKIFFLL